MLQRFHSGGSWARAPLHAAWWFTYLLCACASDPAPGAASAATQTSGGAEQPVSAAAQPVEAPQPTAAAQSATSSDAATDVAPGAPANAAAVEPTPVAGAGVAAPAAPLPAPASVPAAAVAPEAAAPKSSPPATPVAKPAAAPSGAKPQPAGASPAAAAAPAANPAAPPAPANGRIVVDIQKIESDAGQVQAALFRSEAGFPDDPKKAQQRKTVKITNRRVQLAFEDVPPGVFAVLVHHDENADAKMQRGLFGIPSEGWGTTRDAPANFGPPSFDDARMTLSAGEAKRVVIKMRY